MRIKFTAKALDALPTPKEGERHIYQDVDVPLLAVRVLSSGRRTFFVEKKAQGRTQRITLGTFPETSVENARKHAQAKLAEIAEWKQSGFTTPSPIQTRGTLTLQSAIDDYCEGHLKPHAKNPERAVKESRWMLQKYVPVSMQNRPLGEISRNDIRKLHKDVGDAGHFAANRLLQMLRAAIGYSIRMEAFDGGNPCEGVTRYHEPKRNRPLRAEECWKFFQALSKEEKKNPDLYAYVWIGLTTGQRRGDILSMEWSQLNFDSNVWTVPDPKMRNPVYVSLVPKVVAILKARRGLHTDSPYVFAGEGVSGHLMDLKNSWERFRKASGFGDLRLHDMRHSLASFAKESGEDDLVISKMLGHASPAVTRSVYIHLSQDTVRAGYERATKNMLAAAKRKPKQLGA